MEDHKDVVIQKEGYRQATIAQTDETSVTVRLFDPTPEEKPAATETTQPQAPVEPAAPAAPEGADQTAK